jgi:uncharacterized membrane protein YbhN (UPF0104 family)
VAANPETVRVPSRLFVAASKAAPLLKIGLGAGIFAWMAFSGKLDFAQIGRSFAHWPIMLSILGLGYFQAAILAWRWQLLLSAQEIPLPFRRAWGLTMIGLLFNVAIPGSVGGDLIKGYYITRATEGRKAHAATSILLDRIVGLIGLFFLGAVMVVVEMDDLPRNPATSMLGALTVAGFAGGLAGLYAAILAGDRLSRWGVLPRVARSVFAAFHEYRRRPGVAPAALALSVGNQAITCLSYYLALRSAAVTGIPLGRFFLVAPLGFAATAIPLSPAGIGVGQAAFFALFEIVAPAYASAGAAALTSFQAITIVISLTGLFWYIPYRQASAECATVATAKTPVIRAS